MPRPPRESSPATSRASRSTAAGAAYEQAGPGAEGGDAAAGLNLDNGAQSPEGGVPADGGDGGSLGLAAQAGLAPPEEEPVEQADDDAKTKLTPAAKLSVHLVFEPGAANVTDFELTKDEVSIGRGKNCDIVLNDKKSSRKNAIIRRAGLSFSIKDLDSANGTFVNGVRVQEQELSGDDIIKIGNVEFQFKALSADYSAREQDFMPVPEDPVQEEEPPPPEDLGQQQLAAPAVRRHGYGGPHAGGGAADPNAAALALQGGAAGADPAVGIPGITGIGPADIKRMGLIEKIRNFKQLPRKQQIIIGVIVAGLVYFIAFDDDDEVVAEEGQTQARASSAMTGNRAPQGPADLRDPSARAAAVCRGPARAGLRLLQKQGLRQVDLRAQQDLRPDQRL